MTKRTSKKSPPPPEYPKVLEQFGEPYLRDIGYHREPSCFNGIVKVRRYRVTVELIDEPDEVIRERIVGLWRASDNHHHVHPLRSAGRAVGMELEIKDFGRDSKRGDRA